MPNHWQSYFLVRDNKLTNRSFHNKPSGCSAYWSYSRQTNRRNKTVVVQIEIFLLNFNFRLLRTESFSGIMPLLWKNIWWNDFLERSTSILWNMCAILDIIQHKESVKMHFIFWPLISILLSWIMIANHQRSDFKGNTFFMFFHRIWNNDNRIYNCLK